MAQALVWVGLAAGSFATAAVLVIAMTKPAVGPGDPDPQRAARRLPWRSEPAWWQELEREFADDIRATEGRRP